jgi:hypothetical protein
MVEDIRRELVRRVAADDRDSARNAYHALEDEWVVVRLPRGAPDVTTEDRRNERSRTPDHVVEVVADGFWCSVTDRLETDTVIPVSGEAVDSAI